MSIDFTTLQGLTIPEGVVTQITDESGRVIWAVQSYAEDTVVLKVEKITSDTYAGETTYTGEQFILLDIYPKTNGTVKVTYGGLTKTITDTSGAAEPNAQQVFFGTFNGVTDEVATPASGTLTIKGEYANFGFACGSFSASSKSNNNYCGCITAVTNWGNISRISNSAFRNCQRLTSIVISETVTYINIYAFFGCSGLTSITIPKAVTYIGSQAFYGCSGLTNVTFDNTSGWCVDKNATGQNRESVDVTDTANNATLLTDTYLTYYWYRT